MFSIWLFFLLLTFLIACLYTGFTLRNLITWFFEAILIFEGIKWMTRAFSLFNWSQHSWILEGCFDTLTHRSTDFHLLAFIEINDIPWAIWLKKRIWYIGILWNIVFQYLTSIILCWRLDIWLLIFNTFITFNLPSLSLPWNFFVRNSD